MNARLEYTSTFADVAIPDVPLTEHVLRKAASMPDAIAMIDGVSGETYSFAALSEAIHRLAGGLASLGVEPGTTVALMAPNMPAFAIVFHAVAVCGAVVTTINPTYGAEEIRYQLDDAEATLLVTTPDFLDQASEAVDGSGVRELLLIGKADGHRSIDDIAAAPLAQVPLDAADALVVLPYSSGTTGLPKGVMLTHRNLVANIEQTNAVLVNEAGQKALAVLPFFHIYGMQALMNSLLADGVTVITLPRFDMVQVLTLVEKHRIDHLYAVPPIILGLARAPIVDAHDLSSLQRVICAAAPLGAELALEASARIGCTVSQAYGMTELSPVSHGTPAGHDKPGSSGLAAPNTECRVIGEDGSDRGIDDVGELLVRGPQVMRGYLGNVKATDETVDADGWLHTGDVVRIDADGHLFVVDRVKELIKVKGFQVAPAELEAVLVTHPAIADVAVIGVPDDEAGERPSAFVVLAAGQQATSVEISAFLAERVAHYKRVDNIVFVDSIPKSASGKILRRLLRDEPASEPA